MKAFDCVDHNKLWNILQEMGIPDHLPDSWETFIQVKKQQLEPYMEQLIGSKLGKEYDKAVYCHPAYLTYIYRVHHVKCWAGWITSWNQISKRNINNLRYADDTTLMAESEVELKSLLRE